MKAKRLTISKVVATGGRRRRHREGASGAEAGCSRGISTGFNLGRPILLQEFPATVGEFGPHLA